MRRLVAFIACITCAVAIRAPVAAQEFSSRPLTLVVPFAAGGSIGLIARMMLPRMSEVLGHQIVIENMGGADGMTGAAEWQAPCPTVISSCSAPSAPSSSVSSIHKNPPFDTKPPWRRSHWWWSRQILVARKDFAAADRREFVACCQRSERPRRGRP